MLSIQLLVIVLLANSNSSISWLTTAKTSNSRCSNQWAIQQDRKLFLTTRVMTKTLLQLSSNGRYRDSVTDSVINTCNSYQIKESLHTLFMVPPAISSKSFGSKGKNEQYYCDACGAEHVKWMGRCPLCKEWNSVKEFRAAKDFSSLLDPRTARATIKQVVNNKGEHILSLLFFCRLALLSSSIPFITIPSAMNH